MIKATLGNTTYLLDEGRTDIVTIVRRNQDGETEFHVPRALFEAYAIDRAQDVGRQLLHEAFARSDRR